jgi:hypothetical protein
MMLWWGFQLDKGWPDCAILKSLQMESLEMNWGMDYWSLNLDSKSNAFFGQPFMNLLSFFAHVL